MNRMKNRLSRLFLFPLFALLLGVVASGCSDEGDGLEGGKYGYVQFKLYKEASYGREAAAQQTAAVTRAGVDKLGDIRKMEIELRYGETSITQTLILNSYNEENAEFGLRTDKLQLLAGDYRIVGYKLLNKLDEEVSGVAAAIDETFTVVANGLTVKDLTADIQARGMVRFRLTKDGLPEIKRAASTLATDDEDKSFLFSNIALVTVTVKNTFSQETTTFEELKVTYEEQYEESPSADDPNDKYKDIGTALCDSTVWLPAGTYRVTEYTIYSKSGSSKTALDTRMGLQGKEFTVEDNELTEDAEIPVQLSEEAANIKDYKALREIWEALDGKNWSYKGEGSPAGANWNFNKEIDMWGDQPGVGLNSDGRVTSLSLDGFGAKGVVPDAIGQLTELRILSFGSHDETVSSAQGGGQLFGSNGIHPDMTDAQKQKMRMHYYDMFVRRDSREDLSEMLQWVINRDPKQKKIVKSSRIEPKDVPVGNTTNGITAISKAVMRLKNLQQLFIANAPIKAGDVFTDWQGENTAYQELWAEESKNWKWGDLTDLTDIELYNNPNFTELPAFLQELPELQLLNIACNQGIADMGKEWHRLVMGDNETQTAVAAKLQMMYLSYNNLPEFPESDVLRRMKKLSMIDCIHSGVKKLNAFGTEIKLVQVSLDYNEIEEIPAEFCGFTNETETLSFTHNKLKKIPNIFDAKSKYVMGSVDFSDNLLGEVDGKAFDDDFNGINAGEINLSNNRISVFPKQLFSTGSPITTLNLMANMLSEIKEGDLQGENSHLITSIDLRFNRLSELPDDFRATTIPYLKGFDISYNRCSKFPTNVLNCFELQAIGIRHQRDEKGNRILREWPEGITTCPSLLQLQIGGNDIRKVNETMTSKLWIVEVKDNPNISLDVTAVCSLIQQGMWLLIYDKTQDIKGCDALDIER
ncbi:MAG: DUF4458 domain-containing protein [Alistipes sp.]|uniref:DUF4458 domain-containing protein n=1 Tax=Alistipes sp. TaxID=1872444 RepID=UPI0025C62BA6|nr:DUF4458 domain-containing protein [Alistipes sp.]MCD8276119.1 DUF4458 domain-containing protein [Alistipes sp.]